MNPNPPPNTWKGRVRRRAEEPNKITHPADHTCLKAQQEMAAPPTEENPRSLTASGTAPAAQAGFRTATSSAAINLLRVGDGHASFFATLPIHAQDSPIEEKKEQTTQPKGQTHVYEYKHTRPAVMGRKCDDVPLTAGSEPTQRTP